MFFILVQLIVTINLILHLGRPNICLQISSAPFVLYWRNCRLFTFSKGRRSFSKFEMGEGGGGAERVERMEYVNEKDFTFDCIRHWKDFCFSFALTIASLEKKTSFTRNICLSSSFVKAHLERIIRQLCT